MVNGEIVKFKYPEVAADHYRYRGAVEKHNITKHDGGTKSQRTIVKACSFKQVSSKRKRQKDSQ